MARGVRKRIVASRPKVNWVPGAAPKAALPTYPYFISESELADAYKKHMTVGKLFVAKYPTKPAAEPDTIRDFPLLWNTWKYGDGMFPAGTPFMYAGTVRSKEKKLNGTLVVVPRHTFVGPTGRFIVLGIESVLIPADDVGVTYWFEEAPSL